MSVSALTPGSNCRQPDLYRKAQDKPVSLFSGEIMIRSLSIVGSIGLAAVGLAGLALGPSFLRADSPQNFTIVAKTGQTIAGKS